MSKVSKPCDYSNTTDQNDVTNSVGSMPMRVDRPSMKEFRYHELRP